MLDGNTLDELGFDPRARIYQMRREYWTLRQVLLKKAGHRRHWQSTLHFSSGAVTLASALASALVTSGLTGVHLDAGTKLIPPTVTFVSGIISLFDTTYFPHDATRKIADSAFEYDSLVNELDELEDYCNQFQVKKIRESLQTIRKKGELIRKEIDQYIPSDQDYLIVSRRIIGEDKSNF